MSRAIYWLGTIDRFLARLEWGVTALCLLVIVLCTGLGVFFRYALNNPLIWANDLGIVSLVWLTFMGGSALYKERGHIAVELVFHLASARAAAILAVCLTVLMGVGIAIIGWQMLILLPLQNSTLIEGLGISRAAYGIPLTWGAASITLSSVRQLLDGSLVRQGVLPGKGA
jgi:TRAP-type C4-dicarboxylate transport system permease small subunit